MAADVSVDHVSGPATHGWGFRLLRPATFVWTGVCELFELQLLSTFVAFGGVSLADLDSEKPKVRMS